MSLITAAGALLGLPAAHCWAGQLPPLQNAAVLPQTGVQQHLTVGQLGEVWNSWRLSLAVAFFTELTSLTVQALQAGTGRISPWGVSTAALGPPALQALQVPAASCWAPCP